jgi:nascent polypeptide-associated complex subunit alpha
MSFLIQKILLGTLNKLFPTQEFCSKKGVGKKMFPGMKNLDPKTMQRMMKQMGIKSEEIDADRVIIEGKAKRIVILNPNVTAIDMQGRKTYTVMGEEKEEETGPSKQDIGMVVKQANVSEKKAEAALRKNEGDIAAAILELKGEE